VTGEYRLSETAAQDIANIHTYSQTRWGEAKANQYVEAIYRALEKLAARPDRSISRDKRSAPFRMIAIRQHFALYEVLNGDVIVLTIMHQAQNVEKHVARLTPAFETLIARMMRTR
jgi:toxin ParE1/3/4